MNKYSLLFLLMTISMFSCRDEVIDENPTTIPLDVDANYQQDIFGQVLTSAGEPIAGATVFSKEEMVLSDDQGFFLLNETPAGNKGVQIAATKDGFLYGGYRLYANEVGRNHVDIVLLEANSLGNIQSSQGGELQVSSNSFVEFPANAFTLNGTDVYSGNVNVTGNWIDPSDPEMLRLTPGDLGAINLQGEQVVLSSFGMIGIELTSDSGQELQIIEGKEATLKFEIPESMLSQAPSTIPLWSFDEVNGIWIEESSADLVGNQYIGTVSHFSWWNTDLPNAVLDFCIKVIDEDTGLPIANAYVYVNNLSGFGCASGYTDYRGILCGLIPADSELQITITPDDDSCPSGVNSIVIGPFPVDSPPIFITVPVDFTDLIVSNISGTVTECNTGDPVENAIVEVYGNVVQTDANGAYSQTISVCQEIDPLVVSAFDLNTLMQGSTTLNNINGGMHTANVSLCDDVDEIFNFDNVLSQNCEVRVRPFETHILVTDPTYVTMAFDGTSTGTYDMIFYNGNSSNVGDITVEIQNFGDVGESVSGIFWSTDATPIQLGSFIATRVE